MQFTRLAFALVTLGMGPSMDNIKAVTYIGVPTTALAVSAAPVPQLEAPAADIAVRTYLCRSNKLTHKIIWIHRLVNLHLYASNPPASKPHLKLSITLQRGEAKDVKQKYLEPWFTMGSSAGFWFTVSTWTSCIALSPSLENSNSPSTQSTTNTHSFSSLFLVLTGLQS